MHKERRIRTCITCLGRCFTAGFYLKQIPGKYLVSFLSSLLLCLLIPTADFSLSLGTAAHFTQNSACNVTHHTLNSILPAAHTSGWYITTSVLPTKCYRLCPANQTSVPTTHQGPIFLNHLSHICMGFLFVWAQIHMHNTILTMSPVVQSRSPAISELQGKSDLVSILCAT